tara:strand:+ start:181 stop:327 length:147 start_codon:yes stop_codon:yes gene_type:complete
MTDQEMTKQDYLAEQYEHEQAMNHYDEKGVCFFCNRHRDEGIHYKCWT